MSDDVDKLLRQFQANQIKNTSSSYSYSKAINAQLRKVLK